MSQSVCLFASIVNNEIPIQKSMKKGLLLCINILIIVLLHYRYFLLLRFIHGKAMHLYNYNAG